MKQQKFIEKIEIPKNPKFIKIHKNQLSVKYLNFDLIKKLI